MDFWDTAQGYHLANALTRYLSNLADQTVRKVQFTMSFESKDNAIQAIREEIEEGNRFISMLETEENVLVIMEKEEI